MDKIKIGINSDRNDLHTGSSLILAALQMVDVQLMPQPLWHEADLVINVDSIHNVPFARGKKTAYLEVDDNLHRGKNLQYYDVDLLYITSPHLLYLYPKGTRPLPTAMQPTIHYDWGFEKEYDIVFVGDWNSSPSYAYRMQVLTELNKRFKMFIQNVPPQNYSKWLSKGKLILNVMPQMPNEDPLINSRFYEGMGIGCLLNNYHPLLNSYAVEGQHYVGFGSIDEAVVKVEHYINHPEDRARIANNAREHVLKNHTWEIRLKQILNDLREVS